MPAHEEGTLQHRCCLVALARNLATLVLSPKWVRMPPPPTEEHHLATRAQ